METTRIRNFNMSHISMAKMSDSKRSKLQDIPFLIDGSTRIVKSVSKYTTCNDVIAKLPYTQTPLAVYLSTDDKVKELPGKVKLLNVWRANRLSKNVEFVIRRSEAATKKVRRSSIFGAKKTCDKQPAKSAQLKSSGLSRNSLKKVSDLAFYVRYQKLKLQSFGNRTVEQPTTKRSKSPSSKLMKKMTSHASTNSMDAFLAKADLHEMARFLNFCGEVAAEKLGGTKPAERKPRDIDSTFVAESSDQSSSFSTHKIPKTAIRTGLDSMKLGLKTLPTSNTLTTRTTSAGSLESTDTGYQSIETDTEGHGTSDVRLSIASSRPCKPRRHTFLLEDVNGVPRHSTPVTAVRQHSRIHGNVTSNMTPENLHFLDDINGKQVIFEKFMADQTLPAKFQKQQTGSDDAMMASEVKGSHLVRHSLPGFRNQQDRCRFLWNKYCDSDSDTDSVLSETPDQLDTAFVDMDGTEHRTLRRESALSNLNRFSLSNRYSLPAHEPTISQSQQFDYSFDCSFPRMDDSQSMDISFSCSESDFSATDLDKTECNRSTDDSMSSFMKTKSYIGETTLDFTQSGANILERNVSRDFTNSFFADTKEYVV